MCMCMCVYRNPGMYLGTQHVRIPCSRSTNLPREGPPPRVPDAPAPTPPPVATCDPAGRPSVTAFTIPSLTVRTKPTAAPPCMSPSPYLPPMTAAAVECSVVARTGTQFALASRGSGSDLMPQYCMCGSRIYPNCWAPEAVSHAACGVAHEVWGSCSCSGMVRGGCVYMCALGGAGIIVYTRWMDIKYLGGDITGKRSTKT